MKETNPEAPELEEAGLERKESQIVPTAAIVEDEAAPKLSDAPKKPKESKIPNKKVAKILFLGLDKAGKTSFLLSLENKYSQLYSLKPTINANRSIFKVLGFLISIFDMGGQERYRDWFLQNEDLILNTDLIFYLMDIQDRGRFRNNADFFEKINSIVETKNLSTQIVVCFHKCDPDLMGDEESYIHSNIEIAERLFRSRERDLEIKYFSTSIYDYSSLILAFSAGILEIIKDSTKIMETFYQDYIDKGELDGICLLDQEALIVYENCKESKVILDTLKTIGSKLAQLSEHLLKFNFEYPKSIDIKMDGWSFFRSFKVKDRRFYLIIYSKEVSDFNKYFKQLDNFTITTSNFLKNLLK